MELELHPAVILPPRSFCTLIAPVEVLVGALNSHTNLQRFKILYICGNYSHILSRMDRNFVDLEIRRAFTAFQLLTILEEARHTLIFVEHDPTLYEDAEEIPEYISQALRDRADRATVVLYAPSADPYLEVMAKRADRVFYLQSPERPRGKRKRCQAETSRVGKPDHPGGILMGRSFESVRMGAKDVADRWLKARRAMKAEDQVYAVKLAAMAKKHSSEAFYAFDDPLEATVFSVLVEMMKEIKVLEERKNTESVRATSAGPLSDDS